MSERNEAWSNTGFRANDWRSISTAPSEQQIIVWEPMYGWLLALHDHRFGWKIKSSGNFYADMPASVVAELQFWQPLPPPPNPIEETQ